MKRTNQPYQRQRIKKQDIHLDILEKKDTLFVKIKIDHLSSYDFPDDAEIFLEAYDRLNIDHIALGKIEDFTENPIERKLVSFETSKRIQVNFRLKIVDLKTWKLLGLAEKLKESKYANSLLPFRMDKNMNTIFKVDCSDIDHPILLINENLKTLVKDIKPVIAENALREILFHLLFLKDSDDDSELKDHKWIRFAQKYSARSSFTDLDQNEKREWIEKVIDEFSKKSKVVKKFKKQMEK